MKMYGKRDPFVQTDSQSVTPSNRLISTTKVIWVIFSPNSAQPLRTPSIVAKSTRLRWTPERRPPPRYRKALHKTYDQRWYYWIITFRHLYWFYSYFNMPYSLEKRLIRQKILVFAHAPCPTPPPRVILTVCKKEWVCQGCVASYSLSCSTLGSSLLTSLHVWVSSSMILATSLEG